MGGVSQTDVIAGALLIAFVIFITVRGDLAKYLAVLGF